MCALSFFAGGNRKDGVPSRIGSGINRIARLDADGVGVGKHDGMHALVWRRGKCAIQQTSAVANHWTNSGRESRATLCALPIARLNGFPGQPPARGRLLIFDTLRVRRRESLIQPGRAWNVIVALRLRPPSV